MMGQQLDSEKCRSRSGVIDRLVGEVVNCGQCHKCCRHSSAFALKHEVGRLRELGVPLHEIDGIMFLTPNGDGRCSCLTNNNKCKIYDERPTACRLFPFYMMDRPFHHEEWVVFNFCPSNSRKLVEVAGQPSLAALRVIVNEIQRCYDKGELEEMQNADRAINNLDRLEVGAVEFLPVMKVALLQRLDY